MVDVPLEHVEQVNQSTITLDALMSLGEDACVEVKNGEIVEMAPVGGLHQIVVGNVVRILDSYVEANGIGTVFVDGLLYLMNESTSGLKNSFVPDVSFLKNESIPANWDISKPFPGVPDLAVEVISPGEGAGDIIAKVRAYLEKGTEQVWVVYPETKELHQYQRNLDPETVRVYKRKERIEAKALFSGIKLTVEDVFRLPGWAKR
jgi:Uma2 family endonuclease